MNVARLLAGWATAFLLAAASLPSLAAEKIDGLTLGELDLRRPAGEAKGLVFLFSDWRGPDPEFARAADRLAELGLIVAPVATPAFLERQDGLGRQCLYLVADIEEASRRIQAAGARDRYRTPIVAGTGMGAAVAYAALAQAPAATLAGAASDGFTTRVATHEPLCPGAPATPAADGGYSYGPHPLPGWWRVGAAPDEAEAAEAFAAAAGAEEALVPPVTGGLGERLAALLEPAFATTAEPLADLPLVELPPDGPGEVMAVVYSGDGGWRDIDKELADRLHEVGVPVVGVDSLRYFWSERTPDAAAGQLAEVIEHYRRAWNRPRVVLIGYSFGADALPFLFNRLPEADRASVARIALLALSESADFEIHVTGWLGVDDRAGSLPTAPELARLPMDRVQCFYGAEEPATACTLAPLAAAQIVKVPGGHHFDGDYGKLADMILDGLAR